MFSARPSGTNSATVLPTETTTLTPTEKYPLPDLPSIFATQFNVPTPIYIQGGINTIFVTREKPDYWESYLELDNVYEHLKEGSLKFSVSQEANTIYYLELVNDAAGTYINEVITSLDGSREKLGTLTSENLIVRNVIGKYYCVMANQGNLSLVFF